jgi:ESS family glutamate:Na+ symporter
MTPDSEAIDSLSFHVAIVCVVYFLSFLFLKGLSFLLGFAGSMGAELATNPLGNQLFFLGHLRDHHSSHNRFAPLGICLG